MYRTVPQGQDSVSKGLLDVIAASKDEDQLSKSIIVVLGGKATEGAVVMDDQFKLPDLVSSESKEGQAASEQEQELLKPLPKPAIKPRSYFRMHYEKQKIKLRAAIQREQQKQKAEELLQQEIELELTLEEIEEKARREDAKQQRAQ